MLRKHFVVLISLILTFCDGRSCTKNVTEDCDEFEEEKKDYSGYQVIRIPPGLDRMSIAFLSKRVDFWESPYQNGTEINFLVSPEFSRTVKKYLESINIPAKIVIKNFQSEIDNFDKENDMNFDDTKRTKVNHFMKRSTIWDDIFGFMKSATRSRKPRKVESSVTQNEILQKSPRGNLENREKRASRVITQSLGMDWLRYHRLANIYTWMEQLANDFPNIVKLNIIGITEEGRNIVVMRIGGGLPNRPAIFIEGGIHAREWISPATVTFIVNELVTNPANRDLLDYYDFFVLPVTNPDGYEYSHSKDRMWRKNRGQSRTLLNIISNCKGVDLNRNFAYNWGEDLQFLSAQGGTPMPCLETYIGDKSFSEAETQAIKNFVLLNRKNIVAYLAYHSFGQKILYPWSHTKDKVPDWAELHHMANAMAAPAFEASGGKDYYQIGTAADLQYLASGGSDDWARGVAGIKWVYLIELPGKGHGFLLPPKWIKHVAGSSFAGLRGLVTAISRKLPRK